MGEREITARAYINVSASVGNRKYVHLYEKFVRIDCTEFSREPFSLKWSGVAFSLEFIPLDI